jgi:hypothetical protein
MGLPATKRTNLHEKYGASESAGNVSACRATGFQDKAHQSARKVRLPLSRTLTTDPEGLELDAAIRGTGKETPHRLGRFLADRVPAESPHYTDSGLELRRCNIKTSDGILIWTVGRV